MPGLFRRSQRPLAVDTSELLDEDTSVDDEPSQPIILPETEECIPQWIPLRNKDCIHSKSMAIAVSIGMLVGCLAISSGLGYYSVFVQKPPPVIDKSYDAFNIPNHKATKDYKKFNLAKKDMVNWNRRKRDLRWAEPPPGQQHSKFQNRADKLSSLRQQNSDIGALNEDDSLKSKNSDEIKSENGGLHNFIEDLKNYKTVDRPLSELNLGPLLANSKMQIGQFASQPHSTSKGSPGEEFYAKHMKPHVDAWKDLSSMTWVERMAHRIKRSNHRNNIVYQQYPWKKMQVVYMAEGDEEKNIFTRDRLQTIHDIEQSIMNHPEFESYCLRDQYTSNIDPSLQEYNGCAPLNSLLTYFYPSRNSDGIVHYDGLGSNLGDIDSALKLAMTHDSFYYYVDENINKTNPKSRLMRTEVLFGAPLRGYITPYDHKEEQSDKYKKFVITYIDLLSKASTDKVLVLYGGNEIFDYEVDSSFWQDITLSLISLACILVLMFILTSFSVWLTFWGIASITLSFPIAFFFYRVVFGIRGLGILNGAAVFVIIGIGVDDVFVFVNIFRQSQHISSMRSRIYHTMTTAGKATFFTSFTTSAAFAANVFSAIPAVHQFGLFMSLIVSCCWITVVVIMPSALYLWHICFRKCEMICYACCVPCNTSLDLPPGGAPLSRQGETSRYRPLVSEEPVDDDDVPMLQMEWPNDNNDVPLLMTNEDEDQSSSWQPETRNTDTAYFGSILQSILYRWVALPVLRIRLVIIGFYVAIFFISVGLMTQLHPATKPPQLFRPDSNLQRFLDLKANLSIESLSCNQCSALYKESSQNPDKITFPPAPHSSTTTVRPSPTTESRKTTPKLTPITKPTTKPSLTKHSTTTANPTTSTTVSSTVKSSTTAASHDTVPDIASPSTKVTPHHSTVRDASVNPGSVDNGFDACSGGQCSEAKDRPVLESAAVIHVVFGLKSILINDTSGHVISDSEEELIYDDTFSSSFSLSGPDGSALRDLCKICKLIAENSDLVKNGSAQCLPNFPYRYRNFMKFLKIYPECQDIPKTLIIYDQQAPIRALAAPTPDKKSLLWIAFAFESTTSKGQGYFDSYKQYQDWETFINKLKTEELPKDSPLQSMFQTSEFWKQVMMEVVAVSSAMYGLSLSMLICIVSVAVFTGHPLLLLIIVISILGMICLVVALFFVAGWELGAVEAVSLSILVGSSVDYCIHLVEGYMLAGHNPPPSATKSPASLRQWRVSASITHIGVSIVSSALTTIVAAIPLTQTTIQPFSKFGQIVAINTSVSIIYTLTVVSALLATLAPAYFTSSWKASLKAFIVTTIVMGILTLTLYIVSRCGVMVPGPNGENLFT